MSDALAAWLLACLDEEEALALATPGPAWEQRAIRFDNGSICEEYIAVADPDRREVVLSDVDGNVLPFVVHWDPRRILAEIEAKRQIIAAWLPPGGSPHPDVPCTSDPEGDPDGENFNEPWSREPCVHHLRAMERRFPHDLVLRHLALPYRDRAGYDESWQP